MSLVVPAVLPVSRRELQEKLALLTSIPSVCRIQIDVVDGKLASPASWPYNAPKEFETMVAQCEMLPALERVEYEIDLMCFDALHACNAWLALGASRVTFHTESALDLKELIATARKCFGDTVSLGLALTIDSPITILRTLSDELSYIQFMGISHIGRQGEPFDERVLQKIETVHTIYPAMPLQIDGGVSLENAKKLLCSGISTLVVGSRIVHAQNPESELEKFEALQNSFGV